MPNLDLMTLFCLGFISELLLIVVHKPQIEYSVTKLALKQEHLGRSIVFKNGSPCGKSLASPTKNIAVSHCQVVRIITGGGVPPAVLC